MRILITGLNSFIATHLAPALAAQGHEICGFGRRPATPPVGTYVLGDILDAPFVAKMVAGAELVIHLASTTSYAELTNHRHPALNAIMTGTHNVLEALRHKDGPKRIIYASTGKVYGRIQQLPLTEDHPTEPINVLGKMKFLAERLVDFYASDLDQATILRIFNVYGPNQNKQFLIPTILDQLSTSEIKLGDIKAKRDYIHICDVVSAFLKALELPASKAATTFNICSGHAASAEDIVETFSTILSREIKIHSRTDLVRKDELLEEYGSFERFRTVTGWTPHLKLRDGLGTLL